MTDEELHEYGQQVVGAWVVSQPSQNQIKGKTMKQEDIEKAWNLLSMHNSELLLERAELLKQLRSQSIWLILKYRVKHWFGIK